MTQPQAGSSSSPRSNRRSSRRQPPKNSTRVRATRNALGLGPNIAVGILDLSETGVRLMLKEDLRCGQEFEVTLQSVGNRQVKVVAQVIWSVATADGCFCVGARFQKPIRYGDLHELSREPRATGSLAAPTIAGTAGQPT
jgi:hypothetical protein